MEPIRLPQGTYSQYYVTNNGSVVKRYGEQFVFVTNTIDDERIGSYVYYNKRLKHISGNHIEQNSGYNINYPCDYLSDRILQPYCNIKIGQEFTIDEYVPRTTLGETYYVESIKITKDYYEIEFYNDRGQISAIYDLSIVTLRQQEEK
jgi:hypothetical protein